MTDLLTRPDTELTAAPPVPCDEPGCHDRALFRIYAAYAVRADDVHPHLARYPGAMYRTCADHVGTRCAFDASAPGTTGGWFVEPIDPTR